MVVVKAEPSLLDKLEEISEMTMNGMDRIGQTLLVSRNIVEVTENYYQIAEKLIFPMAGKEYYVREDPFANTGYKVDTFCIMFWIYLTEEERKSHQIIFVKGFGQTNSSVFPLIALTKKNRIFAEIYLRGSSTTLHSNKSLPAKKWTHFAINCNAEKMEMAIDGEAVGQKTILGVCEPSNDLIFVGNIPPFVANNADAIVLKEQIGLADMRCYTNPIKIEEIKKIVEETKPINAEDIKIETTTKFSKKNQNEKSKTEKWTKESDEQLIKFYANELQKRKRSSRNNSEMPEIQWRYHSSRNESNLQPEQRPDQPRLERNIELLAQRRTDHSTERRFYVVPRSSLIETNSNDDSNFNVVRSSNNGDNNNETNIDNNNNETNIDNDNGGENNETNRNREEQRSHSETDIVRPMYRFSSNRANVFGNVGLNILYQSNRSERREQMADFDILIDEEMEDDDEEYLSEYEDSEDSNGQIQIYPLNTEQAIFFDVGRVSFEGLERKYPLLAKMDCKTILERLVQIRILNNRLNQIFHLVDFSQVSEKGSLAERLIESRNFIFSLTKNRIFTRLLDATKSFSRVKVQVNRLQALKAKERGENDGKKSVFGQIYRQANFLSPSALRSYRHPLMVEYVGEGGQDAG
ncbi:hypothetical protein MHBO_001980, partial [Bonamia ostreae]